MGRPIRIQDHDLIFHITNRTDQAMFLLVPDDELNEIVHYWMRRAIMLHDAEVYVAVWMSNHPHIVARFPAMNMHRFMCYLQANLAREVNVLRGRYEASVFPNRYSAEPILDRRSLRRMLAYVLCNPVAANLVARPVATCKRVPGTPRRALPAGLDWADAPPQPSGDHAVVRLLEVGPQKISVIKVIREHTGLGLRESKEIADTAPGVVAANLPRSAAQALLDALLDAGATAGFDGEEPRSKGADAADGDRGVALVLTDTGPNKIEIIKIVRFASGMGLMESKDLADTPPGTIKRGMTRAKAESFLARIREAGGDGRIDE